MSLPRSRCRSTIRCSTLHDDVDAGERVTLTPHNAWQSPWTWVRDSQELWFNVRRSLRGEPLDHLV